ncbi:tRNA uridine(34) 5-carboxymethylaminomethyl modification radical SAM/GNAT enzyme Elp3 [Nanoarchaeota archaeon]
MTKEFYRELEKELKGKQVSARELAKIKNKLCKKYKVTKVPTNVEILTRVPDTKLKTKPVRSQSGVIPIAVMTAPHKCPHGKCIYCPGGVDSSFGDVPQSYTGKEPSCMRAIRNNYDPYLIVMNRLQQFVLLGHNPQKVELIIQGGTFPSTDIVYQKEVIMYCFKALNDFSDLFFDSNEMNFEKFKEFFELPGDINDDSRATKIHEKLLKLKKKSNLPAEQFRNEKSKIKCVGLTIETRPDWGKTDVAYTLLDLGCTRVELGVQSVYDSVLKTIERGHTVNDTIESIRILKDFGFKICAHVMPGLPGVSYEKDLKGLKELFNNPDFRPDMLKIYPCQVSKGTKLYDSWKEGKYKPLDANTAAKMIAEFKEVIPRYCRIQRILRDVPTKHWEDGVEFTNLRQYIHDKYTPNCKCIRCKEPKDSVDHESIKLHVESYEASKGKEFFISLVDREDNLIGFCRVRIPYESHGLEITDNCVLIRELHVNGIALGIGDGSKDKDNKIQHKGYGKILLLEAEKLAKELGKNKVVVISGIGVRDYYRKLGYVLEGKYMVKILDS